MADKIEDGGPAFPVEVQFIGDGTTRALQTGHMTGWVNGLSIRDRFALEISPALISELYRKLADANAETDNVYDVAAIASYEFADAMLKARKGEL